MTLPSPTFTRTGSSPRQPPGIVETAGASVLVVAIVLALLWAVTNPLGAAVVGTTVATLGLAGRKVGRRARRRLEFRRRAGRTREVCFDRFGVCVEL